MAIWIWKREWQWGTRRGGTRQCRDPQGASWCECSWWGRAGGQQQWWPQPQPLKRQMGKQGMGWHGVGCAAVCTEGCGKLKRGFQTWPLPSGFFPLKEALVNCRLDWLLLSSCKKLFLKSLLVPANDFGDWQVKGRGVGGRVRRALSVVTGHRKSYLTSVSKECGDLCLGAD